MAIKSEAPGGFEPPTSCLLDRRSNQLSYGALTEEFVENLVFNENVYVKETRNFFMLLFYIIFEGTAMNYINRLITPSTSNRKKLICLLSFL